MKEPHQIETVAEGLIRIPLQSHTLAPATRTNTYVVCTPRGFWIIDPGAHDRNEHDRLIAYLETLQGGLSKFRGYLLTHHHRDHWGGLPELSKRLPGPVISHSPHLIETTCEFAPVERFSVEAPNFQVVHTPGHASDHWVLITPNRDVVAGDLIAGVGTVVINPPDGDMGQYLKSLERLLKKDIKRLFPAHGPTVDDGPRKLREYISHRLAREEKVASALKSAGQSTAEALVPMVYGTEIPVIWYPVATRSVTAHLIKLAHDGRVDSDGNRYWLL